MSNLEQLKKKFRKNFIIKKSLNSERVSAFSNNLKTNPQNKFNYPRILRNLKSHQIVVFYMLNNNFFYAQVPSTVAPYPFVCLLSFCSLIFFFYVLASFFLESFFVFLKLCRKANILKFFFKKKYMS